MVFKIVAHLLIYRMQQQGEHTSLTTIICACASRADQRPPKKLEKHTSKGLGHSMPTLHSMPTKQLMLSLPHCPLLASMQCHARAVGFHLSDPGTGIDKNTGSAA